MPMRAARLGGASWFTRPGRHVLQYNDFVAHREELFALLREGRVTITADWNHDCRDGGRTMDAFVYVVEVVG